MQTRVNGIEAPAQAVRETTDALTRRARREARRLGREVTDTFDSRLHDARRTVRRGRHAVEDIFDDVEDVIRKMPVRTVLAGVGIGALLGVVTTLVLRRRRIES